MYYWINIIILLQNVYIIKILFYRLQGKNNNSTPCNDQYSTTVENIDK